MSLRTAKIKGDVIELRFKYNPHVIQVIRSLALRKWFPKTKHWECANVKTNVEILENLGFTGLAPAPEIKPLPMPRPSKEATMRVRQLGLPLKPYQYLGIARIEDMGGRALLADEMGLGKSLQCLGYTLLHPLKRPVIIVGPKAAKLSWCKELSKWLHAPSFFMCNGQTPLPISDIPKVDYYLITYDVLRFWVEVLKRLNPQIIVLDECHHIKDSRRKRTKATRMLCKGVPHVIPTSGTPILNRPIEIFTALNLVRPDMWDNHWAFAQQFCAAKHNGYGWDFNGASNQDLLYRLLIESCLIRRRKRDVFKELPAKVRTVVPMEVDKKILTRELQGVKRWVEDNPYNAATAMVKRELTIQAVLHAKMDSVVEWVREFVTSGEPLVLFANHHFALEKLREAFPKSVRFDGTTSDKERLRAVDDFQNGKTDLFLGNIDAAGVAITLSRSSNVGFVELGKTPGAIVQAEDRAYGRADNPHGANIWYLMGMDTIEERVANMIADKAIVIDQIIDGGAIKEDGDLLSEIMEQIEKEGT